MKIVSGNILDDDSDAIVIPVNCVGVMGKGLALQVKQRWPMIAKWHAYVCSRPEPYRIHPGELTGTTFVLAEGQQRRMVWLAATKAHWRDPSRIEWVDECCRVLARHHDKSMSNYFARIGVPMLAVPALGCGLGELKWADVLPIMERHFKDLDVRVYQPY